MWSREAPRIGRALVPPRQSKYQHREQDEGHDYLYAAWPQNPKESIPGIFLFVATCGTYSAISQLWSDIEKLSI